MKKIIIFVLFCIAPLMAYCDWNDDGAVDILDIVATVEYILNPYEFPIASFTVEPASGTAPLEVIFTNTSYLGTGDLLGYEWNFGDDSNQSFEENPIHTFSDPGQFTVSLTVTTTVGYHSTDLTISVSQLPGDFEMVLIPAGDYTYGADDQIQNIDYAYQIMKYEVTNSEYLLFIEDELDQDNIGIVNNTIVGNYDGDDNFPAGNYVFLNMDAVECRIEWDGSEFSIISGYENHPVVDVSWFGAYAFAQYYELRLPTEQEWEKAARGNSGSNYPFGDNIDGSHANYSGSGDPYEENEWEVFPQTTPVGFYDGQNFDGFQTTDSPSPYGVYDLSGNVWEWCDSWLDETTPTRVRRGGSWSDEQFFCQSWYRHSSYPVNMIPIIGFRCVLDVGR